MAELILGEREQGLYSIMGGEPTDQWCDVEISHKKDEYIHESVIYLGGETEGLRRAMEVLFARMEEIKICLDKEKKDRETIEDLKEEIKMWQNRVRADSDSGSDSGSECYVQVPRENYSDIESDKEENVIVAPIIKPIKRPLFPGIGKRIGDSPDKAQLTQSVMSCYLSRFIPTCAVVTEENAVDIESFTTKFATHIRTINEKRANMNITLGFISRLRWLLKRNYGWLIFFQPENPKRMMIKLQL